MQNKTAMTVRINQRSLHYWEPRSVHWMERLGIRLLTPAMLPQSIKDGLSAKGHQLDIRNVKGVGSVKAILIDPRTGVLLGGVSPTGDSYVMAW